MNTNPLLLPDHYLSQGPSREYTPPLSYTRIVIPLNGLDQRFMVEIASLMEWSNCIPEDVANMDFVLSQAFQQIGDCLDPSHLEFMRRLCGNMSEKGSVPGYPSPTEFMHFDLVTPEKWPKFVVLFRNTALELFSIYSMYISQFPTRDFLVESIVPNGIVFLLTERSRSYLI